MEEFANDTRQGVGYLCWNWELLVHICAECFQVNRGDSTDKSDEGPFILLIVPCCHPTIRILWIIGVSCFLVHTFLWISNSLRTRNNQNTIYQLISLTNYSVIHCLYRKFKAEQTFKYCPVLEKATVCCPVDSMLSHFTPLDKSTLCLSKVQFNIALQSTPRYLWPNLFSCYD